jgi:hypothetical protein
MKYAYQYCSIDSEIIIHHPMMEGYRTIYNVQDEEFALDMIELARQYQLSWIQLADLVFMYKVALSQECSDETDIMAKE